MWFLFITLLLSLPVLPEGWLKATGFGDLPTSAYQEDAYDYDDDDGDGDDGDGDDDDVDDVDGDYD